MTDNIDPKLVRVLCTYDHTHIDDIDAAVAAEFAAAPSTALLRAKNGLNGARIAVAVGSRGIANLQQIVRAVIRELKAAGAEPFVVPAMGSHGGATDSGQAAVLASYGITEAGVGAPIRSSMETVQIPAPGLGHKAFMDRAAWESDGVILVARIKPHTDFHSSFESGLIKMAVIGLGKHDQAKAIHSFGVRGLKEKILPTARHILATGKILAGIGLVENAYDETQIIRLIPADRIEQEEPLLLQKAHANMPRLPVDEVDVLVIDRMGKDISGTGMDTNIIGRIRVLGQTEPDAPKVGAIVTSDLTPASHGNAVGLGLADVITRRMYDSIDFGATNENVITSSFLDRGKVPLVAETDRKAVEYAIRGAAVGPERSPRIVRMIDTLHVHDLLVSAQIAEELRSDPAVQVLEGEFPLFAGDDLAPYPTAHS